MIERSFIGISLQEILIDIRAVNNRMATSTIAECLKAEPSVRHVGRLWIHVTLETEETALSPEQQMTLYRSMRLMTSNTSFNPQGRMFIDKRPALFRMTGNADLKIHFSELRGVQSSMGAMAVGAFHQAFR